MTNKIIVIHLYVCPQIDHNELNQSNLTYIIKRKCAAGTVTVAWERNYVPNSREVNVLGEFETKAASTGPKTWELTKKSRNLIGK